MNLILFSTYSDVGFQQCIWGYRKAVWRIRAKKSSRSMSTNRWSPWTCMLCCVRWLSLVERWQDRCCAYTTSKTKSLHSGLGDPNFAKLHLCLIYTMLWGLNYKRRMNYALGGAYVCDWGRKGFWKLLALLVRVGGNRLHINILVDYQIVKLAERVIFVVILFAAWRNWKMWEGGMQEEAY